MEENVANNKITIAVFDDDPDLLEIYRFLLEAEGFMVAAYHNCDEILDKLRLCQPSLVLMDNWIPSQGGEAAIAQLKADPELATIPVILISASNDFREVASRAGADGAIAKPFDFEQVLRAVADLLK
ncbi:response regulator [Pedobacter sp.]